MNARDDYPLLTLHADDPYAVPSKQTEIRRALDEIDRLRHWKAEAIVVLARWDAVAERFDLSEYLGEFTADAVGAEIDRLRA